uniref:Calponin-homology (CH) domain-containing protein n=1 Tax=Davidia involucrata TaxID=16924 RepID=A0A5B7C938_DAVIN
MGPAVAVGTGDPSSSFAESNFRELDDVFLQTQTRIWLGEVLHTRLDEQLHISDLLADGELLFEVSKVILKMLLAKCMELRHVKAQKYKPFGSRKSSGRYRPYSNVDSFLKICKSLGLNGIDLFSPSDVVEKRHIRKVCICIRSFSMKARSKQLNVPDFDIVTYTVAMPTNMVGCIRRSLELSQFSFTSSASVSPYESSRSKYRRKKSIAAACGRNYDSCSEGSDDTVNNYMGAQSYSSSTNYSCDTASLKNSDVEKSQEVSSMLKKYASAQDLLESEILDQEKDEDEQSHYESECLAESVGSLCSQYVDDDHQLESMSSPCVDSRMKLYCAVSHINNGVRHSHENGARDLINLDFGLGNDVSVVGDSLDDNTAESCISHQLAFSDLTVLGTDSNYPAFFDGGDSMINLYMGTDSHGSRSTQRTSQNGFGKRFFDDIEDVEVSSTTSMNSVSGRRLSFDFDDQFDADDKTAKVNFTELQNYEADRLDKSPMRGYESQDMAKYETPVHSFTPDTEKPQSEMKLENFKFSTKLFLPCPDDWKSYATGCEDHVDSFSSESGMSQINSGDALWLKGSNFVVAYNDKEVKGTTMVESHPDIKERRDNNVPATCSEDSGASCNAVAVEESERCHRINRTDDGSGIQHQDIIIEDIISLGAHTSYILAVDNPAVNPNSVVSANQSEPTAQKHPFSTIEISPSVGREHYQACTDHNEDLLHCAESTNKDERKHEIVDILAEEISDGRKYTSAGVPESKPHRRPLLKTVVKGTAIFGVLFLLLHLRSRSGREKTGEANKQSSQIEKSNGVEFSKRNGQKGSRVNGIYPAEKLKLGN